MSDDKITVSVNEFKNWLEGVLDMMPKDWVPDAEQWGKVRNKIDQLDDSPVIEVVPVVEPVPAKVKLDAAAVPQAPAAIQKNPRPAGPNIDMEQKVKLPDPPEQPARRKHVQVQKTRPAKVIDAGDGKTVIDTGTVHKMGEIDTSDGNYKTSFL